MTYSKVLDQIFAGTNIGYSVLDKKIILSAEGKALQQAGKKITGTVLDQNGESVIGANVVVKGTTNGTITDVDGKFTLEVLDDAVLQVTYIGYNPVEVKVGKESVIRIVLREDTQALDEVVVVGYGTQKKVSVTGSIASVSSEDITKVPTSNIAQNLAGRMPGLVVNQTTGRPGEDSPSLRVRGFGANDKDDSVQRERPLVIVDGVQRDFSQLDPNEIESVTVLKDASAAVYGVQASDWSYFSYN